MRPALGKRTTASGVDEVAAAPPAADSARAALAPQRQALILDRVRQEGAVRVADLVEMLGVSDMTVRRDLGVLHARGLLEKVHGGAAAIPGSALFEPGFSAKSQLMETQKEAIASAAMRLVEPGTAIAISAGTTTYALARHLVDVPGLTVVTNSVPVADVLYTQGRVDQTIILSGGVRTPSDALVGPFAVDVIRSLHVDTVFLGVHGLDVRYGFTTPNILESATNRAMIEAGRRLVVLADHTKWGVIGVSSIAPIAEADILIMDDGLDDSAQEELLTVARKLVIVPSVRVPAAGVPETRRRTTAR